MSNNHKSHPLVLQKLGQDEELYKRFTRGRGDSDKITVSSEITNEEAESFARAESNQNISNFFFDGMGGDLSELADLCKEQIIQANTETKEDVIKEQELKVKTDEEFKADYERQRHVFKRTAEEKARGGAPAVSKSTDYVVEGNTGGYVPPGATASSGSGYRSNHQSAYGYNAGTTGSSSGYQAPPTNNNTQSSAKKREDGQPDHLGDHMGRIFENVQHVATQKVPGWNEKQEEGIYQFHSTSKWKKFLRKTKSFFKSKKGRVTVKVFAMMCMQLGMAVAGKRYQFDGAREMFMFLGFMMGSFFLTRELVEDGFDPRGLGI